MKADVGSAPESDQFELTLIGPGYGESVVVHLGRGLWMIVDSCVDSDGDPRPLRYLEGLRVDPSEAVRLVVATHWHDDHIRGVSEVLARCGKADFCCSAALRTEEFLAAIGRMEARWNARVSSGVREMSAVLSSLGRARRPSWALADRRLYLVPGAEVWALSPDDAVFERFLRSLSRFLPSRGEPKRRVTSPSPNEVSVVLWVNGGGVVALLGADLERTGWRHIVDGGARPGGRASAFKLPHHGSENAHEPAVWQELLTPSPVAVVAPWIRGGRSLPEASDVRRILTLTSQAYTTARPRGGSGGKRNPAVARMLRETGVEVRRDAPSDGAVRLRRPLDGGGPWQVELLGSAARLSDKAVPA